MSNISRKKPPVESLVENLRTLKRKHKQSLRKNKALAASKQKLTEQCKALNRKREIFSIHFLRLKSWIEDKVNALQKVTLNEIKSSLELLGQSLDPDGGLSLTPVEHPEGQAFIVTLLAPAIWSIASKHLLIGGSQGPPGHREVAGLNPTTGCVV
ncbi:uncharacterized protein LOC135375620 isoform X2 [Ornithodoros turicata]